MVGDQVTDASHCILCIGKIQGLEHLRWYTGSVRSKIFGA